MSIPDQGQPSFEYLQLSNLESLIANDRQSIIAAIASRLNDPLTGNDRLGFCREAGLQA